MSYDIGDTVLSFGRGRNFVVWKSAQIPELPKSALPNEYMIDGFPSEFLFEENIVLCRMVLIEKAFKWHGNFIEHRKEIAGARFRKGGR